MTAIKWAIYLLVCAFATIGFLDTALMIVPTMIYEHRLFPMPVSTSHWKFTHSPLGQHLSMWNRIKASALIPEMEQKAKVV